VTGDLAPALAELGIILRHPDRPGEHRAPCRWCDRGPRDDTLAVKLDPSGSATWFCHRCGERGGIGPERSEGPARPAAPRHEQRGEPERHDTLAPWARAFWAACRPIWPDTIAAAYLAGRGCALPPWPEESDLRWRPDVRHPAGHVGPALVALVTDVDTYEPISLHRTWIQPDGSGKAELAKPRLLLAKHRSDGVIRLWPDDEVTIGLVLGEGIETALAAAAHDLTPAWACLSAGNLARFPVLPGLEGLTILVDHDRPDKRGRRAGIGAATAVIQRYVDAGFDPERDLVVILPPGEGNDACDLAAMP
jgi:putative DNA primase/helicase